jgi:hypothetical protein
MQRAIATGSSAASDLFSGAFTAGRTAATVGATTLAGAGGGAGITGAIAAGAVATTAAAESLVVASINGSGGSSLIGSLAQMNRGRDRKGGNSQQEGFPPNDPTGDKTIADLLRKSRNSPS